MLLRTCIDASAVHVSKIRVTGLAISKPSWEFHNNSGRIRLYITSLTLHLL